MKIALLKQVPQVEIVDVELPYYFEHDLSDDYGESIIYGKIEEKMYTSIHETIGYDGREDYKIEKEKHSSIENSGLASYFEAEHQSNRLEFDAAKQRCLMFLYS